MSTSPETSSSATRAIPPPPPTSSALPCTASIQLFPSSSSSPTPTQVSTYFTQQELVVSLTTLFGVLALVLASIGLYGLTSYGVSQRVPEIGLRMALGSDRAGILGLILRGAMMQTLIGLALGIPSALFVGHLLQSQLFGVKGHDLVTLLTACTVLALSTLIAGAIPARRAANVEPMHALRSE